MPGKGRHVTHLTISLGVLVLLVAGYAFKDKALEQWYLWKLASKGESEKQIAVEELGKMGSVRAIPMLIELFRLRPDAPKLRYAAVDALCGIGQPAVPALNKALDDENEEVRMFAAFTLGQVGQRVSAEGAIPLLIETLKDKDLEVRMNAAWALGVIRAREAVPALTEMLRDQHIGDRRSAAQALGYIGIGAKDAVPALTVTLEDEDTFMREYAAEALKKIQGESSDGHER